MYTTDSCTGALTPTTPATVATGGNEFGAEGLAVDPSSKFAYVTNPKDNTVSMFSINPGTGNLTPNSPATVATGTQPWPIVVEPSGKFVYGENENDTSVSIYTVGSSGVLTSAGSAATGGSSMSMAVIGAKP